MFADKTDLRMIITEVWAHRRGDRILHGSCELEQIISILECVKVPKCEGIKKPGLDVKQGLLNSLIDFVFVSDGWENQPYIDNRLERKIDQRGDFSMTTKEKVRVFVEVEFGNTGSVFRDLFKFNVAHSLETYDCGILILPMRNLQRRIDGIAPFERVKKLLEAAPNSVDLPLILIGIDSDGTNETEQCLVEINDSVDFWRTQKTSDFDKVIAEHGEKFFLRNE